MTSPNRKFRSSITEERELEIVLLKQCILATIETEYAVSYSDRYYLYHHEGEIIVNKKEDMAANIPFKQGQAGQAVDFFVDLFIYEANVALDKVLFHREDVAGAATPWSTLQRFCGIDVLLTGSIAKVIDVLTVVRVDEI